MGEAEDDFTAMYLAHADRVFAYLCSQLGPQEAEELTAQVFCEAWRQRTTVRLDQGWMPWLIGVARNLARQSAKRTRVGPGSRPTTRRCGVSCPTPPASLADADEQRHQVMAALSALRGLSEADREVVQMCVIAGLSPADAATRVGGAGVDGAFPVDPRAAPVGGRHH